MPNLTNPTGGLNIGIVYQCVLSDLTVGYAIARNESYRAYRKLYEYRTRAQAHEFVAEHDGKVVSKARKLNDLGDKADIMYWYE